MAGLREQALLEVMFEAAEALRGFDRLESRGKKAADTLDKEFDQVDLDNLRGEADQLVSKLVELGDRGDKAFDELRRSVERAGTELQGSDRVAAELRTELDRLRAAQQQIGQVRSIPVLERQLQEAQARAALLRVELARVQREERETGDARGSRRLQEQLRESTTRARLLAAQIDRVRKEEKLMGVGTGAATLGARLTAARAAAVALVAGLVSATLIVRRFGGAVVEVSKEQELADRKLTAAIETLGSQAQLTLDSLKEQAAALQQLTAVGDESIEGIQALIIRISQLNDEQVLGKAVGLSLDLAAAMGTDVNGAAQQVAKSLALLSGSSTEVTTAITNLRRAGIILSAQQQERIKQLAAENQTLEAQKVLLDALEQRYGGTAAAARDTLAGSIQALQAAFGDLLEVVGEGGLGDALRDTVERLRELVEESEDTARALGVLLGASVTALTDLFEVLVEKIDEQRKALETAGAVYDKFVKTQGAASDAVFAFGQALVEPLKLLDRYTFLGASTELVLGAFINRLEEAGEVSGESTKLQLDDLEKLVAAYDRAGREVPGFIRKMVEEAGASLEQLRAGNEQTADSVEEFLASFRLAEEEFAAGVAESAEKAQAELHQLFTFVKDSVGGDLRQATEEQLEALSRLADGVTKAYALAGEQVPEESQKVIDAVEHQIEVIAARRQQQIDLAKSVAEAEEESARRQVKAAEEVAKANLGGELTEDAKAAAEEADSLRARLEEVGDELDRLDQQPLSGEQLANYNSLVDESLALQRQLRDVQRAATELTVAQGSAFDRLSEAEKSNLQATADLLAAKQDYSTVSDGVARSLEGIREATLLAGTEQQSFRDELASTVEGWEKLTAAQQDQLERQGIHAAESKRLITELRETVEKEEKLITASYDRMAAALARHNAECERAHDCLAGLD